MEIISSRKFRDNQGKYFEMVRNGVDVIVKSRNRGSFKIVPISDDDTLMSKEDFFAKLDKSLEQIKQGEKITFNSSKEAIKYFESL